MDSNRTKDNTNNKEINIQKQINAKYTNSQNTSWNDNLRNNFIVNNHLNKYDIDLNQFNMHTNKLINNGLILFIFIFERR